MKRWWIAVGVAVVVLLFASSRVCLRTGFGYGLWLDQCPDGSLQQTVALSSSGLARGGESAVTVQAFAHYTTGDADRDQQAALTNFKADLFLVQAGQETKLEPKKGWATQGSSRLARIELPKVDDGDYLLRTKVQLVARRVDPRPAAAALHPGARARAHRPAALRAGQRGEVPRGGAQGPGPLAARRAAPACGGSTTPTASCCSRRRPPPGPGAWWPAASRSTRARRAAAGA